MVSDLANLRVPLHPVATRITQIQEANLPSAASLPIVVTGDAQKQSDDNNKNTPPRKLAHDQYIDHTRNHDLAALVSTRQLQLHLPAGSFWEENLGICFSSSARQPISFTSHGKSKTDLQK